MLWCRLEGQALLSGCSQIGHFPLESQFCLPVAALSGSTVCPRGDFKAQLRNGAAHAVDTGQWTASVASGVSRLRPCRSWRQHTGRLGGEARSLPAATEVGSQSQAGVPPRLCHVPGGGWRPRAVVLTSRPPAEASSVFTGAGTAASFPSWLRDLSLCLSFPFREVGGAFVLAVRNQR